MRQISQEEAVQMAESGAWKKWSHKGRAVFQMRQKKLCMPFSVFHEAMEKTLGRPVFTHEFGLNWDGLLRELMGKADAPTMEEILALLPAEKVVVVALDSE